MGWNDGRTGDVGEYHPLFAASLFVTNLCPLSRSQSRMRGDYLFYEEKIETTPEEKEAKAARRSVDTLLSRAILTLNISELERNGRLIPSPHRRLPSEGKIGRQSLTALPNRRTPRTSTHGGENSRASGILSRTSRYVVVTVIRVNQPTLCCPSGRRLHPSTHR